MKINNNICLFHLIIKIKIINNIYLYNKTIKIVKEIIKNINKFINIIY